MNYDGLTSTYWKSQIDRVSKLRDKISNQDETPSGRVIPGDGDLTIGKGRRLKVAVMFLDISKFSSRRAESAEEQELLLRMLNLFFSEMIKITEDYGGTVEKNTGDGLMAYFEDNQGSPPEKACKRALSCALTMMAANDHLITPILKATPTEPIEFRLSIDYGYVTIARIGAANRFNANVAIGATANFACKMLSKAQPGEIVLGELAYKEIPMDWRLRFGQLQTNDTGWTYLSTNAPYPLYRYTGRWNKLT